MFDLSTKPSTVLVVFIIVKCVLRNTDFPLIEITKDLMRA